MNDTDDSLPPAGPQMRQPKREASADDAVQLDALEASAADLSHIEALAGGFNVFHALRVSRTEIRHSNFLSWLIDPLESHKAGSAFLVGLLEELLKRQPGPADIKPLAMSASLGRAEVRREWRNIDLLVTCRAASFVLAIENKIDSREHSDQLRRYESQVSTSFPGCRVIFVYLTPDRSTASSESWMALGYHELFEILQRTLNRVRPRLSRDVTTFIEHYLRLIKTTIMKDDSLDERCLTLYRQHRRAIELINTRVRSLMSERLVDQLRSLVEADGRWQLVNARPLAVDFVAREWAPLMPACGKREGYRGAHWLTLSFRCDEGFHAVRFEAVLWEFVDDALRQRVFATLQPILSLARAARYAKGFQVMLKDDVKVLDEDDLGDPAGIVSDVRAKLDQLAGFIAPIKAGLEHVFV